MLCRFALALLIFIGLRATIAAAPPVAQNDSDEPAATGDTYAGIVHSDGPAAWWRFDDERGVAEVGDERLAPQAIVGPAKLQQAGPPRVRFPLFGKENRGLLFDKPASLRFDDPGPNSPFDFAAGDELTIEAWVNP